MISGIHLSADLRKDPGSRITSIRVQCARCKVPKYYELQDNEDYDVAMPNYLSNGGDGYKVLESNIIRLMPGKLKIYIESSSSLHPFFLLLSGLLDTEIFETYLTKRSPVIQGVEHRLNFITPTSSAPVTSPKISIICVLVSIILMAIVKL